MATFKQLSICLILLLLIGTAAVRQAQAGPLDAPDNIACLPFPQPAITGYNGDAVNGPYDPEFTRTTITWRDNAEGEDGYRIDRQDIGSNSWTEIATVDPDTTIYTDDGLDESDEFRYRVVPLSEGSTNTSVPQCRRPRVVDSETGDIRVFYRPFPMIDCPNVVPKEGNTSLVGTCAPLDDAELLAEILEGARENLIDLGFADGVSGTDPLPVDLMPCDGGGCARSTSGSRYIGLRPSRMVVPWNPVTFDGDSQFRTALHEMFHRVQRGLDDPNDRWVIEAQAVAVEDKVCTDALPIQGSCNRTNDLKPGSRFVNEIAEYMADTNRPITDITYNAVLFWTYITEQYGTTTTEPQRGIDWLAKFWEVVANQDSPDAIETINATFDALCNDDGICHDVTFEEVFIDFAVASYVKDFDKIDDKYDYIDDDQPAGNPTKYASPNTDVIPLAGDDQFVLSAQDSMLAAWGARYFSFTPDVNLHTVSIVGETLSEDDIYWHAIAVKDNEIVDEMSDTAASFHADLLNNAYDEVVLIAVGLEEQTALSLAVNATKPTMNIVTPRSSKKALAGLPSEPRKILVQLEVLGTNGLPMAGLNPDDFEFSVSTETVPANQVISSSYIQGQYWFIMRAPVMANEGTFNLSASYQGAVDATSASSVSYSNDPLKTDNVLVIDRSGSMNDYDKLDSAKDAALLYLDTWVPDDLVGIVSYADTAIVSQSMASYTDATRASAEATIDGLTAGGETAIGDGLFAGDFIFNNMGRADDDIPWAMVLLTDGKETETDTNSVEDYIEYYQELVDDGEKVPQLHIIALGADADQGAMQILQDAVGGSYVYAGAPAGRSTQVEVHHALSEAYRVVAETVTLQQQVYVQAASMPFASNQDTHDILIDGGVSDATFAMSIADVPFENQTIVELVRPNGTTYGPPSYTRMHHFVWHVPSPEQGTWQMKVRPVVPGREAASGTLEYLIEASVVSDMTFEVFLGLTPKERIAHTPMPIFATIADTQPLIGSNLSLEITNPNGSISNVTLFDDGQHNDGAANDGFYGNVFYETGVEGSYQVKATASGNSPLNGPFNRNARADFYMRDYDDKDANGLPDHWEDRYPCLENDASRGSDHDHDGLTLHVELALHTNPCNPDSDAGGEHDGSEVARQANPLVPTDDRVQPARLTVWPGAGRNFIGFSIPSRTIKAIEIWRQAGSGSFLLQQVVSDFSQPWVEDESVSNEKSYCYYLISTGSGGAKAISEIKCAVPKADPVAPHLSVEISAETRSTEVTLQIGASDVAGDFEEHSHDDVPIDEDAESSGVVEMRISDSADFSNSPWQPYQPTLSWTLNPVNGVATVFVQVRDGAGNISETESTSMIVEASAPTAVQAATQEAASDNSVVVPLLLLLILLTGYLQLRRNES